MRCFSGGDTTLPVSISSVINSVMILDIPNAYGYVILGNVFLPTFTALYLGGDVMKARKKFDVQYPNLYATPGFHKVRRTTISAPPSIKLCLLFRYSNPISAMLSVLMTNLLYFPIFIPSALTSLTAFSGATRTTLKA